MSVVRPFRGLRPAPGRAAEVVAPPYDVMSAAEARQEVVGRPWSFVHVSRPEVDLPAEISPYAAEVYARGAANLRRMLAEGVLLRDQEPTYYIYRLTQGAHTQTGVVLAASVAAYDEQRIRRHELTRPDKEDDRVRHIEALNAQTGPVFLTYRRDSGLDALVAQVADADADADADTTAPDGVRHMLWVVRDPSIVAALTAAFQARDRLYIADGHHRSAAAGRVAAARRAEDRQGTAGDAAQYFLAVAFPHTQVRILPYHRVIRDLNGLTPQGFLDRLAGAFTVTAVETAHQPDRPGEFGLFAGDRWYRLQVAADRIPVADPVGRLDVSLLADLLLEPVLGIADQRRDARIDFVGGIRGLPELERRVRSGEMAVAIALHPTRIEDLLAVADAGLLMPPKSTWFEPKLGDGMVCHVLD